MGTTTSSPAVFPQDRVHHIPFRTTAEFCPRSRWGCQQPRLEMAGPGNTAWSPTLRDQDPQPCGSPTLSDQDPPALRDCSIHPACRMPRAGCAAAAEGRLPGPSRAIPVSNSRQPGRIPWLLHGTAERSGGTGGAGSHGTLHPQSIPGARCKDTLGGGPGTETFPGVSGTRALALPCRRLPLLPRSWCCRRQISLLGPAGQPGNPQLRGARVGVQQDPLRTPGAIPPKLSPCH